MPSPWDVVSVTPLAAEGGPAPDPWAVVGSSPAPAPRSLGERFVSTAVDAFNRNPTVEQVRAYFADPWSVMKGGVTGVPGLEIAAGLAGEISNRATGALADAVGMRGVDGKMIGGALVEGERQRSAAYQERVAADKWHDVEGGLGAKAGAGAVTLAGAVAGSAADPVNVMGGAGPSLVRRVAGNAGMGAIGDVVAQEGRIRAGIQDRYDPWQTAASAGLGAAIQVPIEVGRPAARAAARVAGPAVDAAGRALASGWEVVSSTAEGAAAPARRALQNPIDNVFPDAPVPRTVDVGAIRADPSAFFGDILGTGKAKINSGARTPAQNAAAGGSSTSSHMDAEAWDVDIPEGMTAADVADRFIAAGVPFDQVIKYKGHVHFGFGPKMRGEVRVKQGRKFQLERVVEQPAGQPPRAVPEAGAATVAPEPTLQVFDGPGGGIEVRDGAGMADVIERGLPEPRPRDVPADDLDAPFTVGEARPAPEPRPTGQARDLTDEALEVLRTGRKVTVDRGQSLLEFIAREGGVRADEAGDLIGMDADRWHRDRPFRPRVVRPEGGMSLEEAASRAYEAGYFRDLARPTMDGADNMHPVDGPRLAEAIREELAGRPRYARDPEPRATELADHVQDLDEMLGHIGVDFEKMSNAQIRKAMDDFFRAPDEAMVYGARSSKGPAPPSEPPRTVARPEPLESFTARVKEAHGLRHFDVSETRAGDLKLDMISVPRNRQRQGLGSAAMRELADYADSAGKRVILTTGTRDPSFGTTSRPRLREFYKRFGFTENRGRQKDFATSADMIRQPRPPRPAPTEPVRLADGSHEQGLIPGVERVNETARALAERIRQREGRRGAAAMPEGGLFDEVARAQTDLFSAPPSRSATARPVADAAPPSDTPKVMGMAPRRDRPAAAVLHGEELAPFNTERRVLREAAKRYYNENLHGTAVPSEALRADVRFGSSGRDKILGTGSPTKLRAIPGLPDMIRTGELVSSTPPWRSEQKNVKAFHILESSLDMGGEQVPVRITVREDANGRFFYDHDIIGEGPIPKPLATAPLLGTGVGSLRPAGEPGAARDGTSGANIDPRGPEVNASRGLGLRAAPRPGAVAEGPGGHVAAIESVSHLADRLKTSLGITHRQGRMTLRGALGEYHRDTAAIRTKMVQELDVLSHEVGHALDEMKFPAVTAAIKRHGQVLKGLDYEPDKARLNEGFAEWFRWYLTNPDHADRLAPNFRADFEAALGAERPRALADLTGIQGAYREYLAAPSTQVVQSTIRSAPDPRGLAKIGRDFKEAGFGRAAHYWSNELYRMAVDDLHPLQMAVRDLLKTFRTNKGAALVLKASENPYAIARMSRGAYAQGHMDVLHGVVPYHGTEPQGPGLADALEVAFKGNGWTKAQFEGFGAYLASRRLVHEWDRYNAGALDQPPDKLTREAHAQAIDDFEARNPQWRDAATLVYEWNNHLWRKEFEAGLLTEQQYKDGLTDHPDYVPLMRDMSDKERVGGRTQAGGSNRKNAGGTRRFRGSTRDIVNPIQSMMQRAHNLAALIARNDTVGAMYDLAERAGPGSAAIIEKIPATQIKKTTVDVAEALEKLGKEVGLSSRDVTSLTDTLAELFGGRTEVGVYRAGEINEAGEPIIYLWRDGERIPLRLPDGDFGRSMFEALTGMNAQAKNLVVDLLAVPSRVLRMGVTTHPAFLISNFVRDQVATWINTDVGFMPGVSGMRGMADEIFQTSNALLYNRMGGIMGGANVASLDKARVGREIAAINKDGVKLRRFGTITGLIRASELSETGSRLGVFRAAYKTAKRQGLDDYSAAFEAAFTARDVLDFDRRGAKMLSAIRIMTFMNAGLQGMDKARRVLVAADQGGRRNLAHAVKAWAKIASLGVLGLSLAALYKDDPEYEEISDYIRATHWMVKVNGQWLSVPKPFELAALSNVLERSYEAVAKDDPTAWGRLVTGLGEIMVPPHEVTALQVPFQLARNRDHAGHPIVPDYLKNSVAPELQFNAYTSQMSRLLGKAIDASPAVIDHIITGMGGSWGRSLLQGTEMADRAGKGENPLRGIAPSDAFVASRFIREPSRGSVSAGEFWDLVSQNGGKLATEVGTFRALMREGKEADARARLARLEDPERDYVLAEIFGGSAKKAHPVIRARDAVRVISELRQDVSSGPVRAGDLRTAITLTREQRLAAEQALSDLALAEMRNALIAVGFEGWRQKQPMSLDAALQRLREVEPRLVRLLGHRMSAAEIASPTAAARAWPKAQARVRRIAGSDRMDDALESRRSSRDRYQALLRRAPEVAGGEARP